MEGFLAALLECTISQMRRNTRMIMKFKALVMNNIKFLLFVPLLLLQFGCATASFKAMPAQGITVSPDGEMASQSKGGIAISVRKSHITNRLSSKLTALKVTLINQTDHPIEFIPKEFLLFDQNERQFFALPKEAISEAAHTGYSRTFISHGFGYHPYYHHWGWHWGGPYYLIERPYYRGIMADALPTGPIKIFPHAIVEGNLYFGVSSKWLDSFRFRITRYERFPKDKEDAPKEYTYEFPFAVIK